jgi:hypothetical protein
LRTFPPASFSPFTLAGFQVLNRRAGPGQRCLGQRPPPWLPDGDMPSRAARGYARELLEDRLLEEAPEQIAKQVEKID